jgi:hypothetical protein
MPKVPRRRHNTLITFGSNAVTRDHLFPRAGGGGESFVHIIAPRIKYSPLHPCPLFFNTTIFFIVREAGEMSASDIYYKHIAVSRVYWDNNYGSEALSDEIRFVMLMSQPLRM